MKISRSKVIEIAVALTIFTLILIYAFIFYKDKQINNNVYAFDEMNIKDSKEVIKEEIENIEVSEITENDLQEESTISEEIVYEDMTLEELTNKLNNSLNSNISGYGNLIASYSLEKGIDPYLATAIMLHETGCTWECSSLVKNCNNVGGMKGSGCGAYGYFNTLEEGIKKFIDNIYNNYYVYGLTNANLMGPKYAEDPEWSMKVNAHIEKIKNR